MSFLTASRAISSASCSLGREETVAGDGSEAWIVRALIARVSASDQLHRKDNGCSRTAVIRELFQDTVCSLDTLLKLPHLILGLRAHLLSASSVVITFAIQLTSKVLKRPASFGGSWRCFGTLDMMNSCVLLGFLQSSLSFHCPSTLVAKDVRKRRSVCCLLGPFGPVGRFNLHSRGPERRRAQQRRLLRAWEQAGIAATALVQRATRRISQVSWNTARGYRRPCSD
jgi:hypothetical protein